uniref:Uncharacterized protein n=1 Tax=Rhizophora mucronata TaxID=61149 RepID=A0A2P2PG31_RHIMU
MIVALFVSSVHALIFHLPCWENRFIH